MGATRPRGRLFFVLLSPRRRLQRTCHRGECRQRTFPEPLKDLSGAFFVSVRVCVCVRGPIRHSRRISLRCGTFFRWFACACLRALDAASRARGKRTKLSKKSAGFGGPGARKSADGREKSGRDAPVTRIVSARRSGGERKRAAVFSRMVDRVPFPVYRVLSTALIGNTSDLFLRRRGNSCRCAVAREQQEQTGSGRITLHFSYISITGFELRFSYPISRNALSANRVSRAAL